MMRKLMKKIIFWLNCARVYSLPITILNWLVIFIFSIKHGGNWILGLVALFGISLVHMATNLIDDYFDYKILSQNEEFFLSSQNCKCFYLKENLATTKELKINVITLLILKMKVFLALPPWKRFTARARAVRLLFVIFNPMKGLLLFLNATVMPSLRYVRLP